MISPGIGIIGGSGLYQLDGFTDKTEIPVKTPYGEPSDLIVAGKLHGSDVFFLPRHGRGHRIAPHEINHRANIWALRSLGVRWIIAVTAVGSLREDLPPRHAVIPDQILDRSSQRAQHSFFGEGIVAHVSMADPYSAQLSEILAKSCESTGQPCQKGGTYVSMDGPAFSTRAESMAYRQLGGSIIGMTNVAEAKLAREAEIALATLAFVTDYDCWKTDEEPVTTETVVGHLMANVAAAKKVIEKTVPLIPAKPDWPEHRALDSAFATARHMWPDETFKKLHVILDRFL